ILLGVGLGAIGGLAASAVISKQANDVDDIEPEDRPAQWEKGERANKAAIAMAVIAPLFLAGGVAMLVIGAKRAKQNKKISLTPSVGGRFAGIVLQGRF